MEYTWKVIKVLPEEQVGKNNLRKRTIVLEEITDKDRKGWLAIDFLKDKCDLIANIRTGDVVTAHINTRVNEYKGRWYNSITCWKVDTQGGNESAPEKSSEDWFQPNEYSDELPF